jgi:hypothetical protein
MHPERLVHELAEDAGVPRGARDGGRRGEGVRDEPSNKYSGH